MSGMSFAFTDRSLKAFKPKFGVGVKSVEVTDTNERGLKAVFSRSELVTFYHRYTFAGVKRAMRLGEYLIVTLDEARLKVRENKKAIERGLDPLSDKDRLRAMPTVREFSTTYIEHARVIKKSAQTDKSKLDVHIVPALGDKRLCEITPRVVQEYLSGLVKSGLASSTANRHLSLLSRLFGLAVEWEIIDGRNPCAGIKKFKEVVPAPRFLSKDEVQRLFKVMDDEPNEVAVNALKLLLLTGCRREEVLQLKWEYVSLESGTIFLPDSKTGARHVQLNSAAIELIRGIKRNAGPYVFPGHRDSMKPINNPRKCFTRLLKAAGVKDHVRIHDIRHSTASLLVANNVSLYTVQKILGHASSRTTEKYSHLSNELLRSASECVADIVKPFVSGGIDQAENIAA